VGRSERWYSSWVINSFKSISAIMCGGGLGWRECRTQARARGGVGGARSPCHSSGSALVGGESLAEGRRGGRAWSESNPPGGTNRSGHIREMSVSGSVHLTKVAAGGLPPLDFASFCCRQLIRFDLCDQIYLVLEILLSSSCEVVVFTPCPILLEIRPLVGLMMSYHIIVRKNERELHPFCFSCWLLFGSTLVEPLRGAALARNRRRRTIRSASSL
jgi:hypothetical protein